MRFKKRVPNELFDGEHYQGRPADFDDKIIERRINLVRQTSGFLEEDKSLVEIGCGNGASLFLISKDIDKAMGIDIEERHKEEFEKYKIENGANNCSITILDIENESLNMEFDRLISFEVIEHLKDDKNVSKYYDLLKKGGIAAFTVPNKWWIFETHGAKLPLLPWNRVPFFSWLPKQIHERYSNARIYTKKRIYKLLTDAGFVVENMQYITAPMDVLKEGALKRFLIKYVFKGDTTKIPFLSTSIFIVAHKK